MSYVYRHIRNDTNEVFYVGIGSDMTGYSRAHKTRERSEYWRNITNNTTYYIEIMLDNLSWQEAINKEIEFIKLYGRKDLGLGTLVNLTNGGEGQFGRKISEATRIKMRERMIGHKKSQETIEKLRISHKGKKKSEEANEKHRQSYLTGERVSPMKGKSHTTETKEKISFKLIGRRHTDEAKKRMSDAQKAVDRDSEAMRLSKIKRRKFSDKDVVDIRNLKLNGIKQSKIAKYYNTTPIMISGIINKEYKYKENG